MIVRKLRLQRGWSQEQLAAFTGLSVRTIQRIEQGQQPGLESLKALAAVFELEVAQLDGTSQQEHEMRGRDTMERDEIRVSPPCVMWRGSRASITISPATCW